MGNEEEFYYFHEPINRKFIENSGIPGNRIRGIFRELKRSGYTTIGSLSSLHSHHDVIRRKPLQKKIINHFLRLKNNNLIKGLERIENPKYLTTQCQEFDTMLTNVFGQKGFKQEDLVLLYGEAGSGKTQLSLTLLALGMLPEELGGLDSDVLFISKEADMITGRMKQISSYWGVDDIEDKYHDNKADKDSFSYIVEEITSKKNESKNYGVIVIDPIQDLLPRADYKSYNRKRNYKLKQTIQGLRVLQQYTGAIVVITSQTRSDLKRGGITTAGINELRQLSNLTIRLERIPDHKIDIAANIREQFRFIEVKLVKSNKYDVGSKAKILINYVGGMADFEDIDELLRVKEEFKKERYVKYNHKGKRTTFDVPDTLKEKYKAEKKDPLSLDDFF